MLSLQKGVLLAAKIKPNLHQVYLVDPSQLNHSPVGPIILLKFERGQWRLSSFSSSDFLIDQKY